jgi:pantetheine-phosphate adenylyltransferase
MSESVVNHVVVPGTFDPVTFGHMDVIGRARHLFSHVTVGVAASTGKNGVGTIFSPEERVSMLRDALDQAGASDVDVKTFSGLLVDFCREVGASGVVKGLRAMTDFEYELQQAGLNSKMAPGLESIFVMSSTKYGYVSSSIVRELASLGADVSFLVPPNVARRLAEHFSVHKLD